MSVHRYLPYHHVRSRLATRTTSLRLAKKLAPKHSVTCIIQDITHKQGTKDVSDSPLVLSLEDSPLGRRLPVMTLCASPPALVGREDRTRKVDNESAHEVFDAIKAVESTKPQLIIVSPIDVRDPHKIPEHYNGEDKARATNMRKAIPVYIHWKYEADKNLVTRIAFKWTILRRDLLSNDAGKGTASIGRTHLTNSISRNDIATAVDLLLDREDAAGLVVDLVGSDTHIAEGLDVVIKEGVTDWLG